MPSFGWKVKPESPRHKILQHIKNHLQVWMKCLEGKILSSFVHSSSLLPNESGGRIARWHYLLTIGLLAHISPGGWTVGPLVASIQRYSLTLEMIIFSPQRSQKPSPPSRAVFLKFTFSMPFGVRVSVLHVQIFSGN
jgi:hypothetical protein